MQNYRFKKIAEKYKLLKVTFIDKGAFKETYRAETSVPKHFAIKVMDPEKCGKSRPEREIEAVKKCNSPHIAKLFDFGILDFNGIQFLFTIEEFFLGGTLKDQSRNSHLTQKTSRLYAKVLCEAISHLKDIDLVHRDIKPANIMFRSSSNSPILVDFGIVRDLSKTSATCSWAPRGPCTPFFAAPEQLNNDKNLIGWRTDQFGIGVTLAYCLTGKHPYQRSNMTVEDAIDAVGNRENYSNEFNKYACGNSLEFLLKMIEPWPVRRYATAKNLLNSIERI